MSQDVKMFDTPGGFEISVVSGNTEMTGGVDNAAYLSLLGGYDWWGDDIETPNHGRLYSRFCKLFDQGELNTRVLRKYQKAAEQDLQWMLDIGLAAKIDVKTSILAYNRLYVEINIESSSRENYSFNWELTIQ